MPLANKSPWSSVGCVCNNRRLGFLFECSKNHSQKQMQMEKIPGFEQILRLGISIDYTFPILKLLQWRKTHKDAHCWLAGVLSHLSPLNHHWIIWDASDGKSRRWEWALQGIKYSNMGSQDCGHHRAELLGLEWVISDPRSRKVTRPTSPTDSWFLMFFTI